MEKRLNRALLYSELKETVPNTNPGKRLNEMYKLEFHDDGSSDLVVCGHVDTFEKIQSFKDSCDIKSIIEQCTITGDISLLSKTEGFYADMTIMPKTRAEALQSIANAEYVWNQLPVTAKEKFDNDMNKFFASAFTPEWYKKLQIEEVKSVEEVKENVENE